MVDLLPTPNSSHFFLMLPLAMSLHNFQASTSIHSMYFLGYPSSKSAYKCYDPHSHRLYHSRHVHFIVENFPFHKPMEPIVPIPLIEYFLSKLPPSNNPPNSPNVPPLPTVDINQNITSSSYPMQPVSTPPSHIYTNTYQTSPTLTSPTSTSHQTNLYPLPQHLPLTYQPPSTHPSTLHR